jgi:hypothetical protein
VLSQVTKSSQLPSHLLLSDLRWGKASTERHRKLQRLVIFAHVNRPTLQGATSDSVSRIRARLLSKGLSRETQWNILEMDWNLRTLFCIFWAGLTGGSNRKSKGQIIQRFNYIQAAFADLVVEAYRRGPSIVVRGSDESGEDGAIFVAFLVDAWIMCFLPFWSGQ